MDDAHDPDTPPIVDGLTLSEEIDYKVLAMAYVMESPYSGTWAENQQPSMKSFYDNLGRVFRGEWWFYDDTDEAAYREACTSHEEESDYFLVLCLFMCYDYFADGTSLPQFTESSYVMLMRDDFGAAMPATRFNELYASGRAAKGSTDRFRLRRETRNDCIHEFMERFHK